MGEQPDAWKQIGELKRKFTQVFRPKEDLKVTAIAHERCVRFEMGYYPDPPRRNVFTGRPSMYFHATTRNVSTMRALAEALLEACDFVDEANPEWAERRPKDG